jgi:hypothetical protein
MACLSGVQYLTCYHAISCHNTKVKPPPPADIGRYGDLAFDNNNNKCTLSNILLQPPLARGSHACSCEALACVRLLHASPKSTFLLVTLSFVAKHCDGFRPMLCHYRGPRANHQLCRMPLNGLKDSDPKTPAILSKLFMVDGKYTNFAMFCVLAQQGVAVSLFMMVRCSVLDKDVARSWTRICTRGCPCFPCLLA